MKPIKNTWIILNSFSFNVQHSRKVCFLESIHDCIFVSENKSWEEKQFLPLVELRDTKQETTLRGFVSCYLPQSQNSLIHLSVDARIQTFHCFDQHFWSGNRQLKSVQFGSVDLDQGNKWSIVVLYFWSSSYWLDSRSVYTLLLLMCLFMLSGVTKSSQRSNWLTSLVVSLDCKSIAWYEKWWEVKEASGTEILQGGVTVWSLSHMF